MHGNLHLSQNITAVQAIVNKTTSGNVYWITIAGTNVNYTGTTNVSTGWVYGRFAIHQFLITIRLRSSMVGRESGQWYWNSLATSPFLLGPDWGLHQKSQGSQTYRMVCGKILALLSNLRVNNVAGSNIVIENTFLEANTAPGHGFPFNTDGFDLAGTNITITDFVIQNGDDAVTVENGASNIFVSNGLIGGPGCHGTSIGSLGQAQAVFNTVKNGKADTDLS